MIDFQTFHQIRQLCDQDYLSVVLIAAALRLDERTVGKSKILARRTSQAAK
jgi:hypothetical protein